MVGCSVVSWYKQGVCELKQFDRFRCIVTIVTNTYFSAIFKICILSMLHYPAKSLLPLASICHRPIQAKRLIFASSMYILRQTITKRVIYLPLACIYYGPIKASRLILRIKKVLHKQLYFHLTHWGLVTHIRVGKLTNICSDNGLSPGRRQAIIFTNAGILLIGPLGTNFSEILIGI